MRKVGFVWGPLLLIVVVSLVGFCLSAAQPRSCGVSAAPDLILTVAVSAPYAGTSLVMAPTRGAPDQINTAIGEEQAVARVKMVASDLAMAISGSIRGAPISLASDAGGTMVDGTMTSAARSPDFEVNDAQMVAQMVPMMTAPLRC